MINQMTSLERAARGLKALAHPTRLMIIQELSEGEQSVGTLEKRLEISQANLSQHLNLMKDKELLTSRRAGNQVFYRLRDNRFMGLMALIQDLFGHT